MDEPDHEKCNFKRRLHSVLICSLINWHTVIKTMDALIDAWTWTGANLPLGPRVSLTLLSCCVIVQRSDTLAFKYQALSSQDPDPPTGSRDPPCFHFLWHHTEKKASLWVDILNLFFVGTSNSLDQLSPMQHCHVFFFFFFFFEWAIVWRVLAGWVRCDGIPQHSRILGVCAFVCALVIIPPFSCVFDVWIKMIPSLQRPAAAFPYFHIHTIVVWFPPLPLPPRLCGQ